MSCLINNYHYARSAIEVDVLHSGLLKKMLVFSFYIFFVDDVHLNARGTLLYWKNMKYAVRKYGLK